MAASTVGSSGQVKDADDEVDELASGAEVEDDIFRWTSGRRVSEEAEKRRGRARCEIRCEHARPTRGARRRNVMEVRRRVRVGMERADEIWRGEADRESAPDSSLPPTRHDLDYSACGSRQASALSVLPLPCV